VSVLLATPPPADFTHTDVPAIVVLKTAHGIPDFSRLVWETFNDRWRSA